MEEGCESCSKWEEYFYWNHLDVKRMHFFKIMIGDFSRHVSVPKKFINHFKGDLSTVLGLKGPSGNTWHVGLEKDADNIFLQSGWIEFIKDHHIEEYDLLVFKYSGNSCFDVLMFDKTGCEKASTYFVKNHEPTNREKGGDSIGILNPYRKKNGCTSSSSSDDVAQAVPASRIQNTGPGCDKKLKCDKHSFHEKNTSGVTCEKLNHATIFLSNKCRLTDGQKRKAKKLAHAIQTDKPFFISFIHPSHVNRFLFPIPRDFTRTHLPRKTQSILLRTPGQKKKWPVVCLSYTKSSFLGGGWKSFAVDNNLKEGDVCLFELAKRRTKKIIVTVHISRMK